MTRDKIIKFAIIFVVIIVIFVGAIIVFGKKKGITSKKYNLTLNIWGVFDNSNAYSEIIDSYRDMNEHINDVRYKKFPIESYKNELLNALAAGKAPDIFMIHNSWLPDFKDKIVPAPKSLLSTKDYRENFVDVVLYDAISDGDIYAIPLSVDSLALYYNKDIFNSYGIVYPPKTWQELVDIVKTITRYNEEGDEIVQSAIAMGTADNVNRSMDILLALMMQGGSEITKKDGSVLFNESISVNGGESINPGKRALEFYTQFAKITDRNLYTWNSKQHYSVDAFAEGKTAMMINYSWHIKTLRAKNEKLNFAVAPLPQISDDNAGARKVNYANYWMFVVAKNSSLDTGPINEKKEVRVTRNMKIHEAWQFLRTIALPVDKGVTLVDAYSGFTKTYNPSVDFTEEYLNATGKPPARLDLIEKFKDDPWIGPFAQGNLVARSWYRPNSEAVERIIVDMIRKVNNGEVSSYDEALDLAASKIGNLIK